MLDRRTQTTPHSTWLHDVGFVAPAEAVDAVSVT